MLRQANNPSVSPTSTSVAEPGTGEIPALPVCTIRVYRRRAWTAVVLRGELDLAAERELRRRVSAEFARGMPILIELAGLEFIDLRGVRALIGLVQRGRSNRLPVEVELHGARGQVARLISRLGPEPQ